MTFTLIIDWHTLVIVLKAFFFAWSVDWELIQREIRVDCLNNVWFWRIYFIQLCFFSLEVDFRFRRRTVLSLSLLIIVLHKLAISFYYLSNLNQILIDVCSSSRWTSMRKILISNSSIKMKMILNTSTIVRRHLFWMMISIEWSSSWIKLDVSVPIQPIDGVGHPTLFHGLGWVDESIRRSNSTHSRGAHPLFEKKEGVK
jgi:hypothetical protein